MFFFFFGLLSVVVIFLNSRKEEFICHVIVELAHSYYVVSGPLDRTLWQQVCVVEVSFHVMAN